MEIPNSAYFIPVSTGKIGLQVLTLALHERGHVIDRLQPQRFGEVQHVTINALWPYAFGAEEGAADLYAGAVLRYAAEQLPESGLPNLPDTQRVRNVIKIFQPLGPDEGPFDVNSGSIIRSIGWVMALGDPSLGFADSLLSTGMLTSSELFNLSEVVRRLPIETREPYLFDLYSSPEIEQIGRDTTTALESRIRDTVPSTQPVSKLLFLP